LPFPNLTDEIKCFLKDDAFNLLLGGEPRDTTPVRGDAAADLGAAGADRLTVGA